MSGTLPADTLRTAAERLRELADTALGNDLVAVLEQAADALEGQDVPADEPVLVLARQILEGGDR
ncbi:hypothetical protein ACFWW5_11010 [Streptomyces albidoflavus]